MSESQSSTEERPAIPTGRVEGHDLRAPEPGAAEARPATFSHAASAAVHTPLPLERFADIHVDVSVEIGRATMPLGELIQLGCGSVVELDRELSEPVSVLAHGVQIATGEIVVVDDHFAVRITDVSQDDAPASL